MELVRVNNTTWLNPELIKTVVVEHIEGRLTSNENWVAKVVLVDNTEIPLYRGSKADATKDAISFMNCYGLAKSESLQ